MLPYTLYSLGCIVEDRKYKQPRIQNIDLNASYTLYLLGYIAEDRKYKQPRIQNIDLNAPLYIILIRLHSRG